MLQAFLDTSKRLFVGYTSCKAQDVDLQCRTILWVTSLSVLTAVIFIGVNLLYGRIWLATMLFVATVSLLPCFRLIWDQQYLAFSKNLLMSVTFIMLTILFVDGGIAGFSIIWVLIFPFLAFLIAGLPKAWFWIIGYFIIYVILTFSHFYGIIVLPYSDPLLIYFSSIYIFFSLVAATFEMHFEQLHMRYQTYIEQYQFSQDNLEKNIKDRAKALEETNENLVSEMKQHEATAQELIESELRFFQAQKMETVGTLVGGIAHDFNNMLAGINANLFMIKRKGEVNPYVYERIENVEHLVSSASDMIRQLLTFSRQDNIQFKTNDLTELFEDAYKLAMISISEHIHIEFKNAPDALPARVNQTQLQQVIMNMINNARDAVQHQKQPRIQIKLEKYQASHRFKKRNPSMQDDEYAALTIIDNGKGIPKKILNKVFEPFFTTKDVGKGTGLGLAMCFGAVKSHGGTIEVKSETDFGTAFKVYLPISDKQLDEHVTTTGSYAASNGGETILLVDDDQQFRTSQKEALEWLGYHVIEAKNGKEAVKIFTKSKVIDLIVMDLTMPVMGGFAAAELIRSVQKNTCIIFVSGYDKDATLTGITVAQGDEVVLQKPYSMEKLNSVIQQVLPKDK